MTEAPIIRTATPDEADALQALISAHQEEGHLLPRTLPDLRVHAGRFLVVSAAGLPPSLEASAFARSASADRRSFSGGWSADRRSLDGGGQAGAPTIVACGELAPLGHDVAEIRSLVVDRAYRGHGLGARLVEALERRARLHGYHRLCAFTHRPDHFLKLGFSMVPHAWLPEKIAVDCHTCPLFRRCGQHAMLRTLTARRGREAFSVGRSAEKDSRPRIRAGTAL
jgi:amino-acid N-acetyltransferase